MNYRLLFCVQLDSVETYSKCHRWLNPCSVSVSLSVCVVMDNSSGLPDQCDSTQQLCKTLPRTSRFSLHLHTVFFCFYVSHPFLYVLFALFDSLLIFFYLNLRRSSKGLKCNMYLCLQLHLLYMDCDTI